MERAIWTKPGEVIHIGKAKLEIIAVRGQRVLVKAIDENGNETEYEVGPASDLTPVAENG